MATTESRVPVVLDGIVGSSRETPGDGGPFVAVKLMSLNDGRVFQRGEWTMLHQGTKLVAPSQTA